jgi:hypothetical protein
VPNSRYIILNVSLCHGDFSVREGLSRSRQSTLAVVRALGSGGDYVGVCNCPRGVGVTGSTDLLVTSAAFKFLTSVSLIAKTMISIRLWHPDNVKVPRTIYHGIYLENVIFTTRVRLLGYGTQAMSIEGCFSIPKGAMALGTAQMTQNFN